MPYRFVNHEWYCRGNSKQLEREREREREREGVGKQRKLNANFVRELMRRLAARVERRNLCGACVTRDLINVTDYRNRVAR